MATQPTPTHYLVPKHEKITAKEKELVLKTYKLKNIHELPVILLKDPALAQLNPKGGEIIKITRESPTAGTSIFYRVVSHE